MMAYYYGQIGSGSSFWRQPIGDPGKGSELASPACTRGAMARQALRNRVGDPAFLQLMRQWALTHRGGNGSVRQSIGLAQRLTGQDLQAFLRGWLYTGSKPAAVSVERMPAA